MEDLTFHHTTNRRASGDRRLAIVGVVASGNLEVLAERRVATAIAEIVVRQEAVGRVQP